MPMQPPLRTGEKSIQRVAKTGGAGGQAIARVGAVQAGRKVGHHHSGSNKRCFQSVLQPRLALQRLFAHRLGQPSLALPRGGGFAQVIICRPEGFVTRLELARVLAVGMAEMCGWLIWQWLARERTQSVKISPKGGAYKTHTAQLKHLAL